MSRDLHRLAELLDNPLACPPGGCNYPGRPLPPVPDIVEGELPRWFMGQFEKDLEKLKGMFEHGMMLSSLDAAAESIEMRRSTAFLALLSKKPSMKHDTRAAKERLAKHIDEACLAAPLTFDDQSKLAIPVESTLGHISACLLAASRKVLKQRQAPCVCDLTHLVDSLETDLLGLQMGYAHMLGEARSAAGVIGRDFGRMETGGGDRTAAEKAKAEAEWEDYTEFVNERILYNMIDAHFRSTPDAARIASIMTTECIMEELGSFPLDWVHTGGNMNYGTFSGTYNVMNETYLLDRTVPSWESKTSADIQSRVRRTDGAGQRTAIACYQTAFMLDPTNTFARLNCAAMRLQLADHGDYHFQWSRVVFDCTAALHYGPPSFKAYYRRGYALSHLALWTQAIADFKQALLLEPKNARVEECLKAAQRKIRI